ncbi:hypothetical protein BDV12DRAFT_176364 [Aspergillus spectabilis]
MALYPAHSIPTPSSCSSLSFLYILIRPLSLTTSIIIATVLSGGSIRVPIDGVVQEIGSHCSHLVYKQLNQIVVTKGK